MTEAGHQASARDIAVIAVAHHRATSREYYPLLLASREYTYNKIKQDNRNLLLRRDPTRRRHEDRLHRRGRLLPGGQRGARLPELAPARKRRLLSVVLGTASREARANESQKLLNWGYQALDAVRLFEAGKAVATRRGLEGHGAPGRARCRRRGGRDRAQGRRRQAEDHASSAPTRWWRR